MCSLRIHSKDQESDRLQISKLMGFYQCKDQNNTLSALPLSGKTHYDPRPSWVHYLQHATFLPATGLSPCRSLHLEYPTQTSHFIHVTSSRKPPLMLTPLPRNLVLSNIPILLKCRQRASVQLELATVVLNLFGNPVLHGKGPYCI